MSRTLRRVIATNVASAGDEDEHIDIAIDPIISTDLASLPSRSRVGTTSLSVVQDEMMAQTNESDPLLDGGHKQRQKKPFYRARPLWIVPFAVLASIARGMTIAPRVEVFTQLSCNAVFSHPLPDYNHTYLNQPHELSTSLHPFNVSDDTEIDDPLLSNRCLSDPIVQAGAARLQTTMITTMGFLTALTTGWWGHFGERHGRTRVLAASNLGLLLTDVVFVLVSLPLSPFVAHGHKMLLIASVIEGLLGGWSTLQSATSSYVSDCTSDGSRAHIFSRFIGVFFFGFALGPMIAAWLISHPPPLPSIFLPEAASTVHTIAPVFYMAVLCSSVNLILTLFVFPESLSKEKRKARREADAANAVEMSGQGKGAAGGLVAFVKGLFLPLMVFAPKMRATGKDWSMTFLALAVFGHLLSSGIFQLKYLYAEHVFAWEAEQLSYYITFVGGARAVHLLFAMPFIIALCKPKPKTMASKQNGSTGKKTKLTKVQLAAEMQFDLRISRVSYLLDLLSHTLVSFSSTAPTVAAQGAFVGFTVLSCLASGVVPSLQSLALCIMQADAAEDERLSAESGGVVKAPAIVATGSLFGAFAVLQATGQMIFGPMIFGLVYSTTVAHFPKGIFVLAASIVLVSIVFLALVQPQRVISTGQKKMRRGSRTWAEPEVERGRSRASKALSLGTADLEVGPSGSSSSAVTGSQDKGSK